jgi:hypothetical protein
MVWSVYLMPAHDRNPMPCKRCIVVIAARSAVEDFLGQLSEAQGFLTDRLEAPGWINCWPLKCKEEGVWILPGSRRRTGPGGRGGMATRCKM